ncbi:hypothetical protein CkaCkLH20_07217 [Colletotrichum karsti]|uniref:Uncharacterized protein n=1 Tax=Colletotrichum karsti TaxID=1095194 RepID=A0A9P6I1T7_9PEZI|nr:uncharacterized protein CkaCkLH20_07217 [Colletotrichum karsti]KAF9875397.1 hypothetical protein CkaCkLH20_07217 [Colletotrichum karsti]
MSQRYTVGDGSPFLKRVIIPFYIVRIAVMIFQVIMYALVISVAANNKEDLGINTSRRTEGWIIAILVVVMVIIAACLLLDIVCIVKRSRRTLTPRFFLIANCIQTAIWTALFILTIAGASGRAVTIIVNIIIYASFLGLLIYASVIYHRHRKGTLRGEYSRTNQNQPTEYNGYSSDEPAKAHQSQPYESDSRYV